MPRCVEVLLPRPLDQGFHYLVPAHLVSQATRGVRVVVPFGHELLTGLIVDTESPPPRRAMHRLRPLQSIVDRTPLLPPELIELLRWTANYYAVPWGELLNTALPPPLLPDGERRWHLAAPPPGAIRGRLAHQILDALARHPKGLTRRALAQRLEVPTTAMRPRLESALRRLRATGRIRSEWHMSQLLANNKDDEHYYPTYRSLLANKMASLSHFDLYSGFPMGRLIETGFHVVVHEERREGRSSALYRAVALAVLHEGRSVLLLTPEIWRCEQLATELDVELDYPVVRLHSELPSRERATRWLAMRHHRGPQLVVGSRSALFAPIPGLGVIIVDEEADPLYKQEERPRLHARDVAIVRAQRAAIPIVLSSRCLSVETYWNCTTQRYHWVTDATDGGLDHAASPQVPQHLEQPKDDQPVRNQPGQCPSSVETTLIDLSTTSLIDGLLSKPLMEAIGRHLARHEQSLLFVNRRGYAPSLICRECGELIRCQSCRTGLAYHTAAGQARELRCRYCGLRMSPPTLCPTCRSYRLGPLGTGTQRAEECLHQLFPQARIVRLDRDALPGRTGRYGRRTSTASTALAASDIIIGTQLCLHQPPPPRLHLVGVLNAELDLSRPDFRAEERMLQTLMRLKGLLQPVTSPAALLIQCRQPNRPVFRALATGRLQEFFDDELAQREALGYPPFSRLATLRISGRQGPALNELAERLAKQAHRQIGTLGGATAELWGPIPVIAQRRNDSSHWQLLLKAPTAAALHAALRCLVRLPLVSQLQQRGTLQIEVDPL